MRQAVPADWLKAVKGMHLSDPKIEWLSQPPLDQDLWQPLRLSV
jgi:hypothetical protein